MTDHDEFGCEPLTFGFGWEEEFRPFVLHAFGGDNQHKA